MKPTTACLLLLASILPASAQWVEEDYDLKAGWNAIWLSIDASYDDIDNLVPGTVEEIWRWNPHASNTQFTQSPAAPVQSDTQWSIWKNGFPAQSTMTTFVANAAYLVKVADATPDFTLNLTGRPVPPNYRWKSSGVNLLGFPMETPHGGGSRNFETFFSYSPELAAGPDIFKYNGGPIGSNPVQVLAPLFEPVKRNTAYWIRSTQYSDYYGPLRITVGNSGFDFGDTGTAIAFKVANVTDQPIDVTLEQKASASPAPAGPAISGQVPLEVRGALDPGTGQFLYTPLSGSTTISLAAGEEKEIVLAVDRIALGGSPGDVAQGLLELTDSEDESRIVLPVSAVTTARDGLWLGTAVVTRVDQIAASNRRLDDGNGNLLFLNPDGTTTITDTGVPAYETTATGEGIIETTTSAAADAPSVFPIRLIAHRDGTTGVVKILQRVYSGLNSGGSAILTADESVLDQARLAEARRLSSSSFPLGMVQVGTGDLGLSGSLSFLEANNEAVTLGYDDPTNPFVHTYHPDHDNKDAQFNALSEGRESYTVKRDLTLTFVSDPTTLGIAELGWGSTVLGGVYAETLTGLRAQPITVQGSFVLRRISDIDTLSE